MMGCLSVCLSRKMSTFSLESPLTIRNHNSRLVFMVFHSLESPISVERFWNVWKISTQCHKFPVICPIVNMACMQKRFMQFWTFLSQKRITRSVWKVLLTGKFWIYVSLQCYTGFKRANNMKDVDKENDDDWYFRSFEIRCKCVRLYVNVPDCHRWLGEI